MGGNHVICVKKKLMTVAGFRELGSHVALAIVDVKNGSPIKKRMDKNLFMIINNKKSEQKAVANQLKWCRRTPWFRLVNSRSYSNL
jgi:hypothetical protein